MTYEEFQRQIGKANLTNVQFAALLKMNRNSLTNYKASGLVPAHIAVIAALMAEMAEKSVDFRPVIARVKVLAKRPRGGGRAGRFGGGAKEPKKKPSKAKAS